MRIAILAAMVALAVSTNAQAAVVGVGASGFELEHSMRTTAAPAKVWAALIAPGNWWNPEHTYSSNAGNMTLAPVAGGCWCEKWPAGQVEHMRVVFVVPNKTLRLRGGLGPLQQMGVDGAMTWTLTPTIDGGTTVTLTMAVGGYSAKGFEGLSRAVDGVLAEQVGRLQRYVETGAATPQATR